MIVWGFMGSHLQLQKVLGCQEHKISSRSIVMTTVALVEFGGDFFFNCPKPV